MTDRARSALMVRLRTLAALELVNIIWIGWAVFVAIDAPTSAANTVGYVLAAGHLFIGAGYWVVKRRQLRAGSRRPPIIWVFSRLEPVCAVALTAGLVVIAAAVMGRPTGTWIPGLVLYGLALAEYVNYFHWQLMHDTRADGRRLLRTRRLRRSHLYEDIRIGRGTRELPP